jgi:hypothetical protein
MTPSSKRVTRESSAFVRERGLRPLIISISGSIVEVRPKGLRQAETMDIAAIYAYAVRSRLARERAEKKLAKKVKKKFT